MTNWKADLDALVEATTAFTKSVRVEPPLPRTIVEPNRMPPVNLNNSERDEIRQRVANFKAHQQRFIRERKDYAASEWKRMLASHKKLDTPTKGPRRSGAGARAEPPGWSKYQPPLERIHRGRQREPGSDQ
jgi:hypothetical protein